MTIGALFCHTLFLPWLALIMIWFFAYWVGWFPITGMISPDVWIDPDAGFVVSKALDVLHHMALPLMTLILIHFGSYLLVMRSSMLETLKDDYIITAGPKAWMKNHPGPPRGPNAALPVVTAVGLSLAFSINGGALTETVFTWPGYRSGVGFFRQSRRLPPGPGRLFADCHRGAAGQPGGGRALRLPGSEDTVLICPMSPSSRNPHGKARPDISLSSTGLTG
jgi:hypothetical protein